MTKGSLPLIVFVAALFCAAARADRIERTDGRVLEGRIVEETKDAVTIEARAGELMFRQRVSRANIRSLKREVREGPGYCVIPIEGAIGVEVTADALKKALADARQSGASIVILSIDSPGGWVEDRDKMLNVLIDNKDLTVVAHVKQALSAAAVLALACPGIYMTDRATIGAAVAYRILPSGAPASVEAKVRAAIQAGERAASPMGGRSDLWIRGMSEPGLELAIVRDANDKPELVQAGTYVDGETVIKRKGKILTLTADEALEWGLSAGKANTLDDLRKSLGLAKWHNAGDGPAAVMAAAARRAKTRAQDRVEGRKELARLDADAAAALRKMTIALAEMDQVRAAMQREAAPILAEANGRLDEARRKGASAARVAAIQNDAQRKFEPIKARHQAQIDAAQRAMDSASKEYEALNARRAEIIASLTAE